MCSNLHQVKMIMDCGKLSAKQRERDSDGPVPSKPQRRRRYDHRSVPAPPACSPPALTVAEQIPDVLSFRPATAVRNPNRGTLS